LSEVTEPKEVVASNDWEGGLGREVEEVDMLFMCAPKFGEDGGEGVGDNTYVLLIMYRKLVSISVFKSCDALRVYCGRRVSKDNHWIFFELSEPDAIISQTKASATSVVPPT